MIKDVLLNRYGPIMTIPDVAEVFHQHKQTIYNKIYKNTFELQVFKVSGKLAVETDKVAEYIETQQLLKR
jgi:hypothetical protein